ncbi:MAG: phosphotriesterase-related protein [Dehalococcoidia bacterium]|nr:phosphotriesterase-related protein [Dehalococcoidia bacterium]
MTKVNTVLGPVPVAALGRALMHEHVFLANPGWDLDSRNAARRESDLTQISTELAALREYGVKTILDPSPADIGRNLSFMVDVARRSGINIIATTGLYKEDHWLPVYFRLLEIDEIADWMVSELTEGMGGTEIKAGAIKVATSLGRIGEFEEKTLRAAARAHKKTGAPIVTHTEGGTMGKEQIDIFESEGADLSRIVNGHCCGNSDLLNQFDILKRGAIVGVDRIGVASMMPDVVRRGIAMSIISAGYASQLLLSQDIVGIYYGRSTVTPPRPPERTYTNLLTDFIPKLREAGVAEMSIETVLADLPRKFFGD